MIPAQPTFPPSSWSRRGWAGKELQFPEGLRAGVYALCRVKTFHELADRHYKIASREAAAAFMRLEGIKSVYLRGGALKSLVPAVSDLDLTLFLQAGLGIEAVAELIVRMRGVYRSLRRRYWVLGELLIVGEEDDKLLRAPANSLALYCSRQQWIAGHRVANLFNQASVSPQSRFLLCSHLYFDACEIAVKGAAGLKGKYRLARMTRILDKVVALCGGAPCSPCASLGKRFALAFAEVDRLAEKVRYGLSSARPPKEPSCEGLDALALTAYLRKASGYRLEFRGGELPGALVTRSLAERDRDLTVLSTVFDHWLSMARRGAPRLPFLLSAPMAECLGHGLTLRRQFLRKEPSYHPDTLLWHLVTRLALAVGEVVSLSWGEHLRGNLKSLCRAALWIQDGQGHASGEKVSVLSKTRGLLEELSGSSLEPRSLISMVLHAKNEVRALLERRGLV